MPNSLTWQAVLSVHLVLQAGAFTVLVVHNNIGLSLGRHAAGC